MIVALQAIAALAAFLLAAGGLLFWALIFKGVTQTAKRAREDRAARELARAMWVREQREWTGDVPGPTPHRIVMRGERV